MTGGTAVTGAPVGGYTGTPYGYGVVNKVLPFNTVVTAGGLSRVDVTLHCLCVPEYTSLFTVRMTP